MKYTLILNNAIVFTSVIPTELGTAMIGAMNALTLAGIRYKLILIKDTEKEQTFEIKLL